MPNMIGKHYQSSTGPLTCSLIDGPEIPFRISELMRASVGLGPMVKFDHYCNYKNYYNSVKLTHSHQNTN